jgi:hypothetical protein
VFGSRCVHGRDGGYQKEQAKTTAARARMDGLMESIRTDADALRVPATCRCGTQLTPRGGRGRPRKWCSKVCANRARSRKSRACARCGCAYAAIARAQRYCSAKCRWAPRCTHAVCGKTVYAKHLCQGHYSRALRASKGLTSSGTTPAPWREGRCPECGNAWRSQQPGKKFCNRLCQKRASDRARQPGRSPNNGVDHGIR